MPSKPICCGSNKTCFRIFVGIHIVYASIMLLYAIATMFIFHSVSPDSFAKMAEEKNLDMEGGDTGVMLEAIRGASYFLVFFNGLHLLFAIFPVIAEATKKPNYIIPWGIYIGVCFTLMLLGLLVTVAGSKVGSCTTIVFLVLFLGYTLALTRARFAELKEEVELATRSPDVMYSVAAPYGFAAGGSGGQMMTTVNGYPVMMMQRGDPEQGMMMYADLKKQDLPPTYDESVAKPEYP